ncbi:uncharacterized protein LOC111917486 [Lactuca sativa]|uniref:uncharacterized protein LOC111917486 n=1 Tax=Lactuca sativa TaxID=4236 RepID=UPI000CD9572E|nr:uncharacterized protein LOC111917486 [Lactuca sativa]
MRIFKESSQNTQYATPGGITQRLSDIDFAGLDKNGCYEFIERFTREKCEKLYYCQPDIDFPKGLTLISNEMDYADFIAIAYECGVILPMYVDHFGNSNMQEWLDEHKEEVVDNIVEQVIDGARLIKDIEIGHLDEDEDEDEGEDEDEDEDENDHGAEDVDVDEDEDDHSNPHFFQKG